jgi:hypothetical protein
MSPIGRIPTPTIRSQPVSTSVSPGPRTSQPETPRLDEITPAPAALPEWSEPITPLDNWEPATLPDTAQSEKPTPRVRTPLVRGRARERSTVSPGAGPTTPRSPVASKSTPVGPNYTEETLRNKLVGCALIPPSNYGEIRRGAQIYYISRRNRLVGPLVVGQVCRSRHHQHLIWQFTNVGVKDTLTWKVQASRLARVWLCVDKAIPTEGDEIQQLRDELQDLRDFLTLTHGEGFARFLHDRQSSRTGRKADLDPVPVPIWPADLPPPEAGFNTYKPKPRASKPRAAKPKPRAAAKPRASRSPRARASRSPRARAAKAPATAVANAPVAPVTPTTPTTPAAKAPAASAAKVPPEEFLVQMDD